MSFDPSPAAVFPGYTFDGTRLYFPIDSIDGLTRAEAHATRGDWRALLFSLCSTLQRYAGELAPSDTTDSFKAFKRAQRNSSLGVDAFTLVYRFRFTQQYLLDNPDVMPEPPIT